MPIPIPNPTPDQLLDMSAITGIADLAELSALIAADEDQDISNARWAKAQRLLDAYNESLEDAGDIKKIGTIEFFERDSGAQVLKTINLVRRLYGLAEIERTAGVSAQTCSVDVEFEF